MIFTASFSLSLFVSHALCGFSKNNILAMRNVKETKYRKKLNWRKLISLNPHAKCCVHFYFTLAFNMGSFINKTVYVMVVSVLYACFELRKNWILFGLFDAMILFSNINEMTDRSENSTKVYCLIVCWNSKVSEKCEFT